MESVATNSTEEVFTIKTERYWLTNMYSEKSLSYLIELRKNGRNVTIGPPQATDEFSVYQLKLMHRVGIWEIK